MWYFWAIGRYSTIFKNARQENARKENIQIFGWPYIEVIHAIQIKFKLLIIQSYSWVWAGWSKMKIPRNCALFPFLPLIHDTLGFSFKFYKILNKPRCSPQCISFWKLLLLCHSVIKICDMIPMSILAKGLVSTVGDRVMTCYNLILVYPGSCFCPLIWFLSDHIFLLFFGEIFLILVSFTSVLVYWFSNFSVYRCDLEELI